MKINKGTDFKAMDLQMMEWNLHPFFGMQLATLFTFCTCVKSISLLYEADFVFL